MKMADLLRKIADLMDQPSVTAHQVDEPELDDAPVHWQIIL